MNLIIGENFSESDRAGRIASYNVTNNLGAFFILFISGRIAATGGGENWPYAYLLGFYCFITTAVFYVMIKNRLQGLSVRQGPGVRLKYGK